MIGRILTTMVAVALAASLAGCDGGSPVADGGPDGTGGTQPGTLEEWCAAQPLERCVEGFYFLYDQPGLEACVLGSDPMIQLYDACSAVQAGAPVTTIPPPGSEEDAAAELERRRERLRTDRPALSAELAGLLVAAHPGERVEVALVVGGPVTLEEADTIVAGAGSEFDRAWRTDYVCLAGEGVPTQGPTRVADRNGVLRAEQLRTAADQSETPVTGYFILNDMWARMAQSQLALEEPGVLIEALSATVPVEAVDALLSDPGFSEVWVGLVDEWLLALSDPPRPECPSLP